MFFCISEYLFRTVESCNQLSTGQCNGRKWIVHFRPLHMKNDFPESLMFSVSLVFPLERSKSLIHLSTALSQFDQFDPNGYILLVAYKYHCFGIFEQGFWEVLSCKFKSKNQVFLMFVFEISFSISLSHTLELHTLSHHCLGLCFLSKRVCFPLWLGCNHLHFIVESVGPCGVVAILRDRSRLRVGVYWALRGHRDLAGSKQNSREEL